MNPSAENGGGAVNRIANKDLRKIVCEILNLPGFRLEQGRKHLVLVAPDGERRGVPTTTNIPHKHVFRQFVRNHSDAVTNGGLLDVRRKKEGGPAVSAAAELNAPQFEEMERLLRKVLPRERCNSFIEETVRSFRRAAPVIGKRLTEDPVLGGIDGEFAGFTLDTLEQAGAKAIMAMRAIERPGFPRDHHNRFTAQSRKVPERLWEPWKAILVFCHRWYKEFGSWDENGARLYTLSMKEPVDALMAIEVALQQTPEKAMQAQARGVVRHVIPTLASYCGLEYLNNGGAGGGVRVNRLSFEHQPYGMQFALVVSPHAMEKALSSGEVARRQRKANAERDLERLNVEAVLAQGNGDVVGAPDEPTTERETEAAKTSGTGTSAGEVEVDGTQGGRVGLSEMLISAASHVEVLEAENRELWRRVRKAEGELAEAVVAAETRGREQAREQLLDRLLSG